MVDQHVLLEWSLSLGNLFIIMITSNHITKLDQVEGEFLFIIDEDIKPATDAINSSKGAKKRRFNFIVSENSKQWNKVRDLSNNVINYLGCEMSTIRGEVISQLNNVDSSKLSLVYIDTSSQNRGEILKQLHKKLQKNAIVIIKGVDLLPISHYINEYNLVQPAVVGQYLSLSNSKRAFTLNAKASRTKSNMF